MENRSQGNVHPNNVTDLAVSRQQAHPISVIWVPAKRESARQGQVEVDRYWLVVNNCVLLSERHVVNHRHPRKRDIERLGYFPIGAYHHILNVIQPLTPRIGHGMHFTGERINFGVRRKGTGQRAKEIIAPDGL